MANFGAAPQTASFGRDLFGHVIAGIILSALLVGLIAYVQPPLFPRRLFDTDNTTALAALFILHCGLFTCASLATSSIPAGKDRIGPGQPPSACPSFAAVKARQFRDRPPSLLPPRRDA